MYDNDIVSIKQKTRENIKKKFLEMYKNKPLEKIKVSDLIKTCDISRGTFYFHFEDIYSLYHECEQDMISLLEAGLSDVNLSTVGGDYSKHVKVLGKHMNGHVEHIDLLQCFLKGSEESSFRKAWFDSVLKMFSKTMEYSSTKSSLKRNDLALFYTGGHIALISNWVLEGCKEPVEDIASIMAQAIYKGIFMQTIEKKTR